MDVYVERTIAGVLFYPRGYTRREVPFALQWEPSDGRMALIHKPFAPGGSFIRIDNPKFDHASNEREAKAKATEFFAPLDQDQEGDGNA